MNVSLTKHCKCPSHLAVSNERQQGFSQHIGKESVRVVIGEDGYAALPVPVECTVGYWKWLVGEGFLGQRILYASKLRCSTSCKSSALDDSAPLPPPPCWMYVDGPGSVVKMLELALRKAIGDPVERIVSPPEDIILDMSDCVKPRFSLIFLHGFRNTGMAIRDRLVLASFCKLGLRVVLPTAPKLAVTAYRGQEYHSWYNYLTDHHGDAADDLCEESLWLTRQRLNILVAREASRMVGYNHVFLGGASQGCAAAFDVFARHHRELGGFLGLVGHPLSSTPVSRSRQLDTPCWFFNGSEDRFMKLHWVRPAIGRLRQAGWKQVHTVVTKGVQHDYSTEVERAWLNQLFDVLLPDVDK